MESNTVRQDGDRVPRPVFEGVVWMGVGLCTLTFAMRAYVRMSCFHRFLLEDFFMLAALLMAVAFAVLIHVNLGAIYELNRIMRHLKVGDGSIIAELGGLDAVLAVANTALKTEGVALMLFVVGVGVIKINYMVFFYRIGHRIRAYLVFWWLIFSVVLSFSLIGLAIIPYKCVFKPPLDVLDACWHRTPYVDYENNVAKGSVIIDVVSDALVILFPISILWNVTIGLRQKITLSAVFALVGLTITVTIVRGVQWRDADTMWNMLLFAIEYLVSFIIACVISFRSLWGQHARGQMENHLRRRPPTLPPNPALQDGGGPLRRRLRHLHDSLLDTFRYLEGTTHEGRDFDLLGLPMPPSGLMTVDFSGDDWARGLDAIEKKTTSQASEGGTVHQPVDHTSSLPGLHTEWADLSRATRVSTQSCSDAAADDMQPSFAPGPRALEAEDHSGYRTSRMEVMYI